MVNLERNFDASSLNRLSPKQVLLFSCKVKRTQSNKLFWVYSDLNIYFRSILIMQGDRHQINQIDNIDNLFG